MVKPTLGDAIYADILGITACTMKQDYNGECKRLASFDSVRLNYNKVLIALAKIQRAIGSDQNAAIAVYGGGETVQTLVSDLLNPTAKSRATFGLKSSSKLSDSASLLIFEDGLKLVFVSGLHPSYPLQCGGDPLAMAATRSDLYYFQATSKAVGAFDNGLPASSSASDIDPEKFSKTVLYFLNEEEKQRRADYEKVRNVMDGLKKNGFLLVKRHLNSYGHCDRQGLEDTIAWLRNVPEGDKACKLSDADIFDFVRRCFCTTTLLSSMKRCWTDMAGKKVKFSQFTSMWKDSSFRAVVGRCYDTLPTNPFTTFFAFFNDLTSTTAGEAAHLTDEKKIKFSLSLMGSLSKDRPVEEIIAFATQLITFLTTLSTTIGPEKAVDYTVRMLSTDSLVAKDRRVEDIIQFIKNLIAYFMDTEGIVEETAMWYIVRLLSTGSLVANNCTVEDIIKLIKDLKSLFFDDYNVVSLLDVSYAVSLLSSNSFCAHGRTYEDMSKDIKNLISHCLQCLSKDEAAGYVVSQLSRRLTATCTVDDIQASMTPEALALVKAAGHYVNHARILERPVPSIRDTPEAQKQMIASYSEQRYSSIGCTHASPSSRDYGNFNESSTFKPSLTYMEEAKMRLCQDFPNLNGNGINAIFYWMNSQYFPTHLAIKDGIRETDEKDAAQKTTSTEVLVKYNKRVMTITKTKGRGRGNSGGASVLITDEGEHKTTLYDTHSHISHYLLTQNIYVFTNKIT